MLELNLSKFKIKGKVINGRYEKLKIIDLNTKEEIKNAKGITIRFRVGQMPTVAIEYNSDNVELDIEVEENKEYGE